MCSRRRLETKPNPEAANLPARNTTENDRVYERAEVRTESRTPVPRRAGDLNHLLTATVTAFLNALKPMVACSLLTTCMNSD